MKIVIPDPIDLLASDWAIIQSLGDVTIYHDIPKTDAELIERIADSEIITISWVDLTDSILQQTPKLKYIIAPAVGYDQIDVAAAHQAGVQVINCPTHNALAVAEYTIALMLAVTRQIVPAQRALQRGEWDPRAFKGTELQGKTLGLIGYGNSGRTVMKLATALGMTVQWANSQTSPDELDTLIAQADILSLHLPLTEQSRHLLDERRLCLMKPTAYLINTARGAIADQSVLLQCLREKRIAGAALDVFTNEPITGTPSAEILELAHLDNVVATPHIAYNTEETVARLGAELIANLRACLAGQPQNQVG